MGIFLARILEWVAISYSRLLRIGAAESQMVRVSNEIVSTQVYQFAQPCEVDISGFQNARAQYVGTGPKGTTPPSQLWANVVQWAASRHTCLTLDRRGWGRMDTCIYMAESLPCLPETITLFVNQLYPNTK